MANRPYQPILPMNWDGQMAPIRGMKEEENRLYQPLFPANWDGQIAPLRGLRNDELRFLDILLCKSQ